MSNPAVTLRRTLRKPALSQETSFSQWEGHMFIRIHNLFRAGSEIAGFEA
jgi:hypothetical protein